MFKKKRKPGARESSSGSKPAQPTPQTPEELSRKRIWGHTDSFKFVPSEYNSSLLQTVEPFLNVCTERVLPEFNKFEGGRMSKETMEAAVRVVLPQYPSTTRVFSTALTELNIRPHHIALLQNFYLLTRPSEYDQASQDLKEYTKSVGDEHEDVSGFSIKCQGEKVKSTTLNWSSNEGIDIDHEAAPEGEDDRKAKGRTDFRIFVWDKSPIKRLDLNKTEKARLRVKRLVSVVESKLDEEKDAACQAAGYSRGEILRNLKNWHIQPIYLITLAAKSWTYAIMDVHGCIALNDNAFTDEDFQNFKKQESVRWGPMNYTGITSDEMKERLKVGLENFRQKYQGKPGASYPNKKYLVGNFYQADKWFPLPMINVEKGLLVRGCLHLYEGLMRMVIGERVLNWTPRDVRRARDIQADLQEELLSIEGLEPTLEEMQEELERQQMRLHKKQRSLGMVGNLEDAK